MRPAVLEYLVHEGRSAPSNTRADERRVPSYSAPLRSCAVLTAVAAAWLLRIDAVWSLPGSREKGMARSANVGF